MTSNPTGSDIPPLTAYVAEFIASARYADIPANVVALAKKSILDTLACGLSGSVAPGTVVVRRYAESLGCARPAASVIGADLRLAPRFAALVNGYAMHADDFDDTYQAKPGRYQGVHATAPVLGAVLADGEARGLSGSELIAATVVGIEVACRIFDATDVRHILNGLHATATCGMLGAAAGVASLRHHGAEATRHVIGFAADQAFGLWRIWETCPRPTTRAARRNTGSSPATSSRWASSPRPSASRRAGASSRPPVAAATPRS